MKSKRISVLVFITLFCIQLLGYRYSLFHSSSQIPSFLEPETVAPFTKLMIYTGMLAGILPTVILMIATSFFCTTTFPSGIVQYTCFGTPFSLSDQTGFFGFFIASALSSIVLTYIYRSLTTK